MTDHIHGRNANIRRLLLVLFVAIAVLSVTTPVEAQGEVAEEVPLSYEPRVYNGRIYGIDSVGSTVVVGGTFTSIGDSSGTLAQAYLFKFDVVTGAIDPMFLPSFDRHVESVAISDDGQSVYVAGNFKTVDGIKRRRIVQLSLADGSVMTEFKAQANSKVTDIALVNDMLVVGGRLTKINGSPVDRLAFLDANTGDLLPGMQVAVTGSRTTKGPAFIQELDVSANGQWLLLGGNFDTVGGQYREQVAVLDISGAPYVSSWSTNRYNHDCATVYASTWIRGVKIDPSSNWFVINTTGAHKGADKLCDTAARFELPVTTAGVDAEPTWVSHTGGDTHWAVEITDGAVYVGGHQRWENNPYPSPRGDNDGPGSLSRKGIAALDPLSGVPLSWNPGRHRGRGVEALHAGDGFLFVGSDTEWFAKRNVERLAVLPIDPNWINPAPTNVSLPAVVNVLNGSKIDARSFDGSNFGAATTISGPGIDGTDWSQTKGGFIQAGNLISFATDDAYYTRPFDSGVTGSTTNLSTSVGYLDQDTITSYDQPYGVSETTRAAYNGGRIFYTKAGSNDLHWRWYSLESGVIGGLEFLASSTGSWGGATGLVVIDDQLYAAFNDGLYRYDLDAGQVTAGGTLVDNGAAGIDWASIHGLFAESS